MKKKITVIDLCQSLEVALVHEQFKEDTLKRYRQVSSEFTAYAGMDNYSQSLGTAFLIDRLKEYGGFCLSDEYSKKEGYYCRFMRMLTEYYNFGLILKRSDIKNEIIWPDGFRTCTELFFQEVNEDGLSYGYVLDMERTLEDLIMYLDSVDIHEVSKITVKQNDEFIKSYFSLAPKGIERKLCLLRRYYRFLFLNEYISIPLAEKLPHVSIQGRQRFPTVWSNEQIDQIKSKADRISPSGKRGYAMIMLAAELGLRIGDIRDLKLTDIDWGKNTININQNKTGKLFCLPLTDDVGWAIIDYLRNGRPVTDSANVFVRHKPPFDAFPINSTMNHIFSMVLNKSKIPPEEREHTGWHTFRRSLATNLLRSNVAMSTISEILGHTDPDIAGKYYIKLDTDNLRKCALSMEVKAYVRK